MQDSASDEDELGFIFEGVGKGLEVSELMSEREFISIDPSSTTIPHAHPISQGTWMQGNWRHLHFMVSTY